ncbi:MAG: hypothetical protein Q4B84_02180 [Clostridia bacterium]|nr:hypothetical protein [Clostridia bacterium]
MSNNKKFLKRTVAAFLAAVNIFNFAGGSGKAILWEENMNLSYIGFDSLFDHIFDKINLKNISGSSGSPWTYYYNENNPDDHFYFLTIDDDEFDFNELDELSKDGGTLKKICFYNIDEDVSKEIKDELYKKLGEIENVLFIEREEFIKKHCKEKLNGSILFPEDETKVLSFFKEISSLISSKLEKKFPNDISKLISIIKNDEFNEILLELEKRKDFFISISKILKGLVEVLKQKKESLEIDQNKKLTRDVLSNGLSYKDNNNECTFSLIDEDENKFLGNINFKLCYSYTFKINQFINRLIDKGFINYVEIEVLKPIKLNDYDEENDKEISNKDIYIKKIDEYIETLKKIIEVISVFYEFKEIETKNKELSEENNNLKIQLESSNKENQKLKSSNKNLLFAAGCGCVGTLLGLGYILKNELSNKCSTAHKKVLELKDKMSSK